MLPAVMTLDIHFTMSVVCSLVVCRPLNFPFLIFLLFLFVDNDMILFVLGVRASVYCYIVLVSN